MFEKTKIDEVREAARKWEEEKVAKSVARFPERKERFEFTSGIETKRMYTPADIEDLDYCEDLGMPGQYPFTRGVQDTMYRGKFWTMRMYAGFSTAEESNKRYKYLIENGSSGLSVAFDLPTQMGYDSSDEISQGEVGKVGVAIDSLKDMEILFDGIPLDKVSTSMTINAPASVLLAMYIAVAEKQGVSADKLRGTIQNDILKEYVARGTYIFPTAPSMRLITNIFEYCSKEVPLWNTISISGYHIREAGSTAVQEVAFTLANGIAYVEAAIKAGLDVDAFAPRLSFFFNAHNNLFEEVAKYRAARRIWARIMKDRFGAKNEKSMMLKFHTQTGGSTLTAQQVENNIVRVAIQTLAAVLGGTQSLHTNSKDEALALPTEESVRTALRTQQIVAYESGAADTIDPLAGSFYVESLTSQIEEQAMDLIRRIDDLGGSPSAIDKGFMQQEIMDAAYEYQKQIENGKEIVVGVNKFQVEEPAPKGLLRVDMSVGELQKNKISALKEERDSQKVSETLEALRKACQGDDNLMPYIIDAVKAYATLGEISQVMRDIFGEYKQSVML
ncbi:MAG: methylmalonyl-CoA mutase family protein [Proteocatella sp.]|nr:methylmalonyl-CoA mutase family protein [Proteocatella sp.]NCB70783.1 methylmalonyl-CoA mutase [Clostridia bacterium]MBP7907906.1 methylmalonyl-CoA mutase family protein [Proteocatella sp.]MBP7913246.1 methylmalonyl-CoA mutase family protein [Proteocatella sp.]MBP8653739.1 methylmalonyl-CoA mutase family protein [Proteocatella sp.]